MYDLTRRHARDALLPRSETQDQREVVLPWRHLVCILRMAVLCDHRAGEA